MTTEMLTVVKESLDKILDDPHMPRLDVIAAANIVVSVRNIANSLPPTLLTDPEKGDYYQYCLAKLVDYFDPTVLRSKA
jgi:hypothetical protein